VLFRSHGHQCHSHFACPHNLEGVVGWATNSARLLLSALFREAGVKTSPLFALDLPIPKMLCAETRSEIHAEA
jgi:hypothetical protein